MHRAEAITAVIVCSLMWAGVMSVVRAADPVAETSATHQEAAAVQKTKTRSNQSNDRAASTPSVSADAAEPAGVVKTKTKSNQSNDRQATTATAGQDPPTADRKVESE